MTNRARFFAVVTYVQDTEQIIEMIGKKRTSIRSYALIKHDKDEVSPHHHIVIRTHHALTCKLIASWFHDDVNNQNTFCEFVHDRQAIIEYLTHENDDDKHKYCASDIIDAGITDILPTEGATDDTYEIIEKMLDGVSTRELCKLYGRDFIYHYASYRTIVDRIREEESELR